jgi:hypothetical protein
MNFTSVTWITFYALNPAYARTIKRPAANCLPNLFESFVARRWAEHDAKTMPSARQSRPERVFAGVTARILQ